MFRTWSLERLTIEKGHIQFSENQLNRSRRKKKYEILVTTRSIKLTKLKSGITFKYKRSRSLKLYKPQNTNCVLRWQQHSTYKVRPINIAYLWTEDIKVLEKSCIDSLVCKHEPAAQKNRNSKQEQNQNVSQSTCRLYSEWACMSLCGRF